MRFPCKKTVLRFFLEILKGVFSMLKILVLGKNNMQARCPMENFCKIFKFPGVANSDGYPTNEIMLC
jgi:hypothetical protein